MTGGFGIEARLPARTGRYVFRRLIGQGCSGCVFEAWDEQLHRMVAIKRMPMPEDERALHEARSAASLRHPAFVHVHEVFSLDSHVCIVMELVRGRALTTLIGTGTTEAQARSWIGDCAAALAEAHAIGIAHGDIKPGNLMIDESGRLRILDFGIACAIDAQRTSMNPELAAGTLRYMSPELLLGEFASAASDIYALGLVLHELLSGTRVFHPHHGLALAHYKLYAQEGLPALSATSSDLQSLVLAMTHRDPSQRPASMLTVRDLLVKTQIPHPSPRHRALAQLLGGVRLRRWQLLALLAAMLIVWPLFTHLRTGGSVQTWRQLQAAQTLLRNYDEDDNLNQAVSELQKILTHQPHHAGAAASLAVAYCILNGGDSQDSTWLKRAEVSAQLALQTDDQLALAHVARAWFLEQVGRLREAEVSYDQALLLDPHELYGLWGRGRMLTRLNRFGEAHEVLRKALVLYPREALLYNTLGALLYKQANYRDAEREFRRSIELKPNSPYGYANLNAALLHQNRVDEALSVLQQGLRIQSNGVLYNNLGNALFARGRFLEAAEAFERALSNSKGNPNDYLKWANLADALRWVPGRQAASNRAYSRALQLLAPQLQAGASDATRLSRASLYAAKLARADQSRTWINAALAHAAEVPDVLFRAAIVAELLDDRVRALQYLKDSLACGFPAHLIEQEPDLQGLRRDLSYHQLLTEDRR